MNLYDATLGADARSLKLGSQRRRRCRNRVVLARPALRGLRRQDGHRRPPARAPPARPRTPPGRAGRRRRARRGARRGAGGALHHRRATGCWPRARVARTRRRRSPGEGEARVGAKVPVKVGDKLTFAVEHRRHEVLRRRDRAGHPRVRFGLQPARRRGGGPADPALDDPLEEWPADRLVESAARASRGTWSASSPTAAVYALKEVSERLARREYRLLRALAELDVPASRRSAIVRRRAGRDAGRDPGHPAPAVLAAVPRAVLQPAPGHRQPAARRAVVLLVRLHLSGFSWSDCSLSNTLFRRDAGAFAAYLVDAETGELHPQLTDGQRGTTSRSRARADLRRAARPRGRRAAPPESIDPWTPPRNVAPLRAAVGRADHGEICGPDEALPRRRAAPPAQRPRASTSTSSSWSARPRAASCGSGPRSSTRASTAAQLLRLTGLDARRTRPAGCSTTSPASAATWAARATPGVGDGRRAPLARGGLRAGGGVDPGRSSAASSSRPRSSTRCSSTAGTCPSRRAATSGPRRRRASYFETVLPDAPDPLTSRDRRHRRVQPHSRPVTGTD